MARPDPIPELKRAAVAEIQAVVGHLDLYAAARFLGVDAPRVSDLRHDRLVRFSVDRLIRMLASAGCGITLQVTRPVRRHKPGERPSQ